MYLIAQVAKAGSAEEANRVIRRWAHGNPSLAPGIASVRTPSAQNKRKKRAGAKAAKRLEHEADEHQRLALRAATSYRALSARCNCLAQDKPDPSFAAKTLCRGFAAPSQRSLARLKRVIR